MVMPPAAAFATTLHWTTIPIAIWCAMSSLEVIVVRHAFRAGAPLGTDLAALSDARLIPTMVASPVCSPTALLIVPTVRLAAGIALPFSQGALTAGLLAVVIACTVLLSIAMHGSDGADKIALAASTAALLIAIGHVADDGWMCLAGLVWGVGQALIAYVTAGAAKLVRHFWRDGTAFAAAMTSHQSGHALMAAAVRHRPVALLLAWAVMMIEVLSPLALIVPPAACIAILIALAAFHACTAIFMGLNTYPWAFAATYPCILMANAIVRGAA